MEWRPRRWISHQWNGQYAKPIKLFQFIKYYWVWYDTTSEIQDLVLKGEFLQALHESTLLMALQDLLSATLILPAFPQVGVNYCCWIYTSFTQFFFSNCAMWTQAWRRVGDALSEMQMYGSAVEHYTVAVHLEPTLQELLGPIIEHLTLLQRLVDHTSRENHTSEQI